MRYLLLCCSFFIGSLALGQSFATVRVMESISKKASFIQIAYDNGGAEVVPLEDWSGWSSQESNVNTFNQNQQTITKTIADIERKGYALLNTSTSSWGSSLLTLFVFRKQE